MGLGPDEPQGPPRPSVNRYSKAYISDVTISSSDILCFMIPNFWIIIDLSLNWPQSTGSCLRELVFSDSKDQTIHLRYPNSTSADEL